MRASRLEIHIPCENCGRLARLKLINDYPFTKGCTEATYECAACGTVLKRARQAVDSVWREEVSVG